jgi:hypothetical protein
MILNRNERLKMTFADDNGNKATTEYWGSEERARQALASLIDCSNCSRCSDDQKVPMKTKAARRKMTYSIEQFMAEGTNIHVSVAWEWNEIFVTDSFRKAKARFRTCGLPASKLRIVDSNLTRYYATPRGWNMLRFIGNGKWEGEAR